MAVTLQFIQGEVGVFNMGNALPHSENEIIQAPRISHLFPPHFSRPLTSPGLSHYLTAVVDIWV